MGLGMASRIAESGYPTAVYNRTRAKSERVGAAGRDRRGLSCRCRARCGRGDDEPRRPGRRRARCSLATTASSGRCRRAGYIVDMSTVPPEFARELSAKARAAGYRSLDACVLGNPKQARDGELRVMVGGDEADVRAVDGGIRDHRARRSRTSAETEWARP